MSARAGENGNQGGERGRSPAVILEEIAAAVVLADSMDPESLTQLAARFQELEVAAPEPRIAARAGECAELLTRAAAAAEDADRASALGVVGDATSLLQQALAGGEWPAEPAAAAAAGPVEKVERDEETVMLFGEFLQESGDGLTRVDGILMKVEQAQADAESVNALFRVFHTIKGTAGFLELEAVVALAHTTETMLNCCRQHTLALSGPVVDVVFDATALMRRMIEDVQTAIEKGLPFGRPGELTGLLAKIEAVTATAAPGEDGPPAAAPSPAPVAAPAPAPTPTPAPVPTPIAAPAPVAAPTPVAPTPVAAAPAPAPAVAPPPPAPTLTPVSAGGSSEPVRIKETIKVDLERVDSLVEMIGELVVVESMVVNAPEISAVESVRVRNCLAQLAKVTRDLQDVGMRMRMVPVSGVFQKMARMVRDLGKRAGKQVRMVLTGEQTEMDRSMVEQIADPLVHMIRNGIDHGIESPEDRAKAGKPAECVIRLSAYHEGGHICIEVADDGRGLDKDAILRKARAQGLVKEGEELPDERIHALIFAPGFSTAKKVTEISGRGVGMDVVKRNVEAMRGRVVISTVKGQGTTFKIILPLTLAIIDGMLVACGEERYIVPTLSIVESVQPEPSMLVSLAGANEMINLRGEILPLVRLDRLFGISNAKSEPTEALVVVLEGVGRRLGLLVDEVVTQQQVVIKSMGSGLSETPFVSGAAILADGHVGLILNVDEIAGGIHEKGHRELYARQQQTSPAGSKSAA
ncbi:chemotaxis protein CheA [Anaeromyxobacter paludicola]|uniref:histidine kinase n=1 Tax=Anaeromyxobacter paludicola TaxID=2918171 RepID=A0ABM7X804_9BACT|nr:chemotaxis protein CheA [Anaeromyxobacter paludicola]BDG07979.1 hypothetical protein AMPC_10920 [Anaeromyxobacter paludicola]